MNTSTALATDITPQVEQQMTAAQSEYGRATALVVTSQAEYESAGDYIATLKATNKRLEGERTELVGPLNAVVKKINARFKVHTDALDRAIQVVNGKMIGWFREQEQIRLKAEAAAAEAARKEQERLRKQAEAEIARAEEIARKEREKLAKQAAEAEAKGKMEKAEMLRKQAEAVEANTNKAEVLTQQAEMVNMAPIAQVTEKQTATTTIVKTWSCQVYDKLALIEAVAKGEASMELLIPNETALNAMARAQKETLKIPGVRAVPTDSIRAK